MMRCARLVRWLVPVLAGILLAAAPVHAQRKRDNDEPLVAPRPEPSDSARLQKLLEGHDPLPDDKALLDRAAQHYVYQLNDPKAQFPPPGTKSSKPQGMHDLIQEVLKRFPDPTKPPLSNSTKLQNQQRYVKEFSDRMAVHILKVLDNDKTEMIARVNAVLLLARLSEIGPEELADPLCQILNDKKQPDAVKFYALRGLRNLFASRKDDAFREDAGEERLKKCLQTLSTFLNRKPAAEAIGTEEEREAFQYVRREAVRALSASRLPLLKKRQTTLSQPALELARVAAGTGLEPTPSLTERVEAAVGLCTMHTRNADKYQPEVAAYYVGRVVVDLATQYDKDRGNQQTQMDYRYYAYLLNEALKNLQQEAGAKLPYVTEIITKAQPVLRGIEGNQPPNQLPLKDVLDRQSQAGKELFKGDVTTILKEAEATPSK